MRHTMLLVAVIVLCALGPPSWAYYQPFAGYGGMDIEMKLINSDVGTQYFNLEVGKTYKAGHADPNYDLDLLPIYSGTGPVPTTGYNGGYKILPTGSPVPGSGSASIEDNWGIFQIREIFAYDPVTKVKLNNGNAIWAAANSTWEITGLFYNEKDYEVEQLASGKQEIRGEGLYAAFFAEENAAGTRTYNYAAGTAGPSARGTDVSGNRTPEMPGVTDSEGSTDWHRDTNPNNSRPLWTFQSVPGYRAAFPQYEFFSDFDPTADAPNFAGNGGMYASKHADPFWGEGEGNWQWQDNIATGSQAPHSVRMQFTMYAAPAEPGWLVTSHDPIYGAATPELSSASLMLIGLFPLGLVAWKRRKQ